MIKTKNKTNISCKSNNFLHSQNYVINEKEKNINFNNFQYFHYAKKYYKLFLFITYAIPFITWYFISYNMINWIRDDYYFLHLILINILLFPILCYIFQLHRLYRLIILKPYLYIKKLFWIDTISKFIIYKLNPINYVPLNFNIINKDYAKNYYYEIIKK
jgi:hypothetical protein